jgi:Outer membrane protein TOM13
MLGLGELLAHEIAFRWGWGTTQVSWMQAGLSMCWKQEGMALLFHGKQADISPLLQIFPKHRSSRTVGPGVEMREDPVERRKRQGNFDPDLMDATSLE